MAVWARIVTLNGTLKTVEGKMMDEYICTISKLLKSFGIVCNMFKKKRFST